MNPKNDEWIRKNAREGMIEPFSEAVSGENVISYGLTSFGYDARIATEFRVFTPNAYNSVVDPKDLDQRALQKYETEEGILIPPNSYVLGRSFEYFRIPKNILGIVLGKSTYARSGIIINVTPLEPGWEGHITIEIGNATPLPAKVYAKEGIAQVVFFEGQRPQTTYNEKKGKYQGQEGVTLPKVK